MSQITRIEKSRKAFKCQKCGRSDELKEMENDEREDDETDGSDEPSAGNPVQEAYNILRAALNGEDGVGDAEAIETALGFLGEALA